MERQNIVMGCIYKMDVEKIHPFISSLFATGTQARLVLFCSNLSKETEDYLDSYNDRDNGKIRIECVPFTPLLYRLHNPLALLWPFAHIISSLTGYNPNAGINKLFLGKGLNLMCSRFHHYYEYLKKHAKLIDRIIFSDIRDVVFQDDPFKHFTFDGVESFCEDARIVNCPANTGMVIMGVGKKGYEAIKNEYVVCAGVCCCTIKHALTYLRLMLTQFLKSWTMDMVCGEDQGIHNAIMYHYIKSDLPTSAIKNMESYTFTMGNIQMGGFPMDDKGRVLNNHGEIVAILHQYDRVKNFKPVIAD